MSEPRPLAQKLAQQGRLMTEPELFIAYRRLVPTDPAVIALRAQAKRRCPCREHSA